MSSGWTCCAAVATALALAAAPAMARDQFQYDVLGRLIRVTYANGAVVQYSYDAAGNRTTVESALDGVVTPPVNHPPVAVNDTGVEIARHTTDFIDVLNNDSDPDVDPLTITSVTGAGASIGPGGAYVIYAAGAAGTPTVGYTISDGRGGTASATVSISVYRTFPAAALGEKASSSSDPAASSSSSTGPSGQ